MAGIMTYSAWGYVAEHARPVAGQPDRIRRVQEPFCRQVADGTRFGAMAARPVRLSAVAVVAGGNVATRGLRHVAAAQDREGANGWWASPPAASVRWASAARLAVRRVCP